MSRRTPWLHIAAVATAAIPAAAHTQEIRTNISPGVATLYDSNLLRSNPIRGGSRDGDIRVTPTVDIDLARMIGRQTLTLSGMVGYDFHDRYKTFNRERINLDAGADLRAGGFCRAGLHAITDYAQTDLAELGVQIGNTTQRRVYSVSASCPKPVGFWVRTTASRTIVTNSASSRSVFNLRGYDVAPALVYTVPSIGDFELTARYLEIVHPNRTFEGLSGADRTRVKQVGLRFQRKIAPRLGGAVGVSYVHSETRRNFVRAYSGPAYEGDIYYTPSPRMTVTLTAIREIKGESSIGAAYFISTSESLSAQRQIGTRLLVDAGLQREHRTFRGESNLFGLPPRGADTSTAVNGGVRYALTRKITLSATAAYRKRDGRNAFYSFDSTTLGAKAGIRF